MWKKEISRRDFLKGLTGLGACALGGGALVSQLSRLSRVGLPLGGASEQAAPGPHSIEAMYYTGIVDQGLDCTACHGTAEPSRVLYCHTPHAGDYVKCQLCPKGCIISEGQRGDCRVRENQGGKLYSMVYGNPCTVHNDPIEKKPFYHFLPGSYAFSLATAGCNLHCKYCFPGDVQVLTDKGAMSLESIFSAGEIVRSEPDGDISQLEGLRVVGADGHYHPVRAAFRHPYKGDMVVINPYYLPELCCTPGHRVLATLDPTTSEVEFIEAQYLTPQHHLVIPKIKVEPEPVSSVDVETLLSNHRGTYRVSYQLQPEQVEFIIKSLDDGSASRQVGEALGKSAARIRNVASKVRRGLWTDTRPTKLLKEGEHVRFSKERRPGIPVYLPLNQQLARLLGYFCAEGSVVKHSERSNARNLYFSFGHSEENLASEVVQLLDELLGLKAHIRRTQTTLRVGVGKVSAALFFEFLCGGNALTKRVPEPIMHAQPEIMNAFLDAYLKGDGHQYASGKVSVTTASRQMAYDLALLLLRVGLLPSIYYNDMLTERIIEGRQVRQAEGQYVIIWYPESTIPRYCVEDEARFYIPIRSLRKETFKGAVYNLEVKKEHTYLAGLIAVKNCQNWTISQVPPEQVDSYDAPPEDVVAAALQVGSQSIAYTYTEPTIFYEYMLAIARRARPKGLKSVVISAGYINPAPLRELCQAVDAIKIDLKGFNQEFYKKVCFGTLEPVLEAIKIIQEEGVHLEIVNLIVPTLNDDEDELRELARWIVDNVGPDVPTHFSRFYPQYQLKNLPPTPVETLERARAMAMEEGINYAYVGNVPGHPGDHTYCAHCGEMIIQRLGFAVIDYHIVDGKCEYCGNPIPGVWGEAEPGEGAEQPMGPSDY